jgi:hypothetical protein
VVCLEGFDSADQRGGVINVMGVSGQRIPVQYTV